MSLVERLRLTIAILLARVREIQPLDRAFTLGSRLFIAILPLSLIAQRIASRDLSVGELLTATFALEGAGRVAAETLFAPPADVGAGLGLFAVVVLVFAVRGFARGLQRLYTDLWRVQLTGPAAVGYQLVVTGTLVAYVLLDIAFAGMHEHPLAIAARIVAYGVLWALVPVLLLGRRIPAVRLAPTILLSAVSVAVFEVISRGYVPVIASGNAERYGLMGFAFALFSWFFLHQVVVVVAALVGAVLDEARQRAAMARPGTVAAAAAADPR